MKRIHFISVYTVRTLCSYLLSMQTAKDIEEYLTELFGGDNPAGLAFQNEFLSHWHPPWRVPSPLGPKEGKIFEELTRPPQEDMILFQGERKASGSNKGGKKVIQR